jgi:hypothetical protein
VVEERGTEAERVLGMDDGLELGGFDRGTGFPNSAQRLQAWSSAPSSEISLVE